MTGQTSNIWPTRTAFAAASMSPSVTGVQVLGYSSPCDGGAATYARLSAAPTTVLAGHLQTADGAWWALERHGPVPVEALGASTSASDNTAALNAAIAWIAAASGGRLMFGAGTYKFNGTIQVTTSNVDLVGQGWSTTTLAFVGGNSNNCITVMGPAGRGTSIQGFLLRDLTVDASGRTGGNALSLAYIGRSLIRDVYFNNVYNGISWCVINEAYCDSMTVQGVRGLWGLYYDAPADGSNRSDGLTLNNVVVAALFSGADGMWWDGQASTVNGNNLTFLHCYRGLWVKNSAESASYYPQFGDFNNLVTDGMQLCGCQFDAGCLMQFTNSIIANTSLAPSTPGAGTQGGQDTFACIINADIAASYTSNFQFDNCQFGDSAQGAVYCAGRDVLFNNCTFQDGGRAAKNIYDALTIAAPAQDIKVRGCKTQIWGAPTNWRYGYNVGAGTYRVEITHSTAYAANTNAVCWANTDVASYCDAIVSSNQGGLRYARSLWCLPVGIVPSNGMTLNPGQILNGMTQIEGSPGPCTITTPTAAQLVASLQSPFVFAGVDWLCINSTPNTMTFCQGTGVTFGGVLAPTSPVTFAVGPLTSRSFKLVFTNTTPGSEAVTIYG